MAGDAVEDFAEEAVKDPDAGDGDGEEEGLFCGEVHGVELELSGFWNHGIH